MALRAVMTGQNAVFGAARNERVKRFDDDFLGAAKRQIEAADFDFAGGREDDGFERLGHRDYS